MPRRRIAVVSPFIDTRHGTERTVAECVSRLARDYDVHIYSQRVEDLDLSLVTWHRIPTLPGPHLIAYLWWFVANHFWRWSDRIFRGLKFDLVFSPGINCFDAGAILVHVVFAQVSQQASQELRFLRNSIKSWHLILHRRLYYALIHLLERCIYVRADLPLAVVSAKTRDDVSRHFKRNNDVLLLHIGLDFERFHPARRRALRPEVRRTLGLASNDFVILLIGNDWKSKGLSCLIEAVARLASPEIRVLVVGRDSSIPFQAAIEKFGLTSSVRFLPPRPDVEAYYAAADVYASPTREDAFALPPAEAMACGLPVITSRNNGGAEIIEHGRDGFVLKHPDDSVTLADTLRQLLESVDRRDQVGQLAFQTAQQLTWEASAEVMRELWEQGIQARTASSQRGTHDSAMLHRRIAVVSPFIDKRHGTERRVAECVSRLAGDYEFHIYSNRVEDVDLSRVTWHRIPALPGPHLFAYLWWFAANHLWRWRDRTFRGLSPDVVYSPGINCLDAAAISVHIVFARFRDCVKDQLYLTRNPLVSWPQLIHRRLYYRLIEALEGHIYPRKDLSLAVVSHKVAADLGHYYGRSSGIEVIYGGLDPERFSPLRRAELRCPARKAFGLGESDFALLLVGNDWKNKGLLCLLQAAGAVRDPRLKVLVAGRDNPAPFAADIESLGLAGRVSFLASRPDVEFFYAAADAYVGPSLEDAFAQPPAESMACGLPVITSRNNGGAEIIVHGQNGFVMEDPTDSASLADSITQLLADPGLCRRLGDAAAETARGLTWEQNARQMSELFERSCRPDGVR